MLRPPDVRQSFPVKAHQDAASAAPPTRSCGISATRLAEPADSGNPWQSSCSFFKRDSSGLCCGFDSGER